MSEDVAAKGVIALAVFAALFAAERLRPAAPSPKGRGRLFVNGALWLMVLAISPLIVLPLAAFAAENPFWRRDGILADWPMLLADLVLLDLWTYWLHRAYHETPLWRLHAPHHFDTHLDSTTALRFHAGEVAASAALRMIPIAALAVPFSHVVLFETLLLTTAMFHHSNVRLPPRVETALSRVIVTPSIHWVHHHAICADTNSNYAGVFSLWDPLFGTRSKTRRSPDMPVGVEGAGEKSFRAVLVAPFVLPWGSARRTSRAFGAKAASRSNGAG
jgi:sterol desaturase/sphingolipid hydroxylase (fatty acid hydroxylase superfamily)